MHFSFTSSPLKILVQNFYPKSTASSKTNWHTTVEHPSDTCYKLEIVHEVGRVLDPLQERVSGWALVVSGKEMMMQQVTVKDLRQHLKATLLNLKLHPCHWGS